MSDKDTHAITRRGNPNMRKGAPTVNRRGRPRVGESLAEACRNARTPDELVSWAVAAMDNPDVWWRERVKLFEWLATRGHGPVSQDVNVRVQTSASYQLPPTWHVMDGAERAQWLEDLTAQRRSLVAPSDDLDGLEDEIIEAEFSEVERG